MSLQTQYRGSTHYIPGASCLDTKAIVSIEEGYNTAAMGIVDSYSESNYGVNATAGSTVQFGQSFHVSENVTLDSVQFYIKDLSGGHTGNMTVDIYTHTGIYGSVGSGLTGSALATSGDVNIASLGVSYSLIEFTFSGANRIKLDIDTNYVAVIRNTINAQTIQLGVDGSSPSHGGVLMDNQSGSWQSDVNYDMCFYVYGIRDPEYIPIGDFKLEDVLSSGEQQQRVTLSLSHIAEYSNNHYQPLTTEHKSAIHYRTDFSDENEFMANWRYADGCTTGVSGLNIFQTGEQQVRHMVFDKYTDLSDVRIFTTFSRSENTTRARAFMQVFRYSDENNYMYIKYDNTPAGSIILGDITWNGLTARDTIIQTVTGVSIKSDGTYAMLTLVHNDSVVHFGSTDGYNYTKHIDIHNIYGSSWNPLVVPLSNISGSVGFLTLGKSSGNFITGSFEVDSMADQYTYDTSLRHISMASGIQGVSIRQEFSDMTDMLASTGSCWAITSDSAIRYRMSSGASWDTLFTSGNTFEDFVATCYPVAEPLRAVGMAFGNTTSFYSCWVTPGRFGGALERFDQGRMSSVVVGSHIEADSNIPFEMKMAKSNNRISWYMNGLLLATIYGITSADILNSPGRIGVITWGQTVLGLTATFSDFKVSTLDYPVESFSIDGNNNPRAMLERFVPRGYVVNSGAKGVNVIEIGASRGVFEVNSLIQNPSLSERYNLDMAMVSIQGDKYSSNLVTGISRTKVRIDDSHIVSNNDGNINSSNSAIGLAQDIRRDENINIHKMNTTIITNPTIEPFDNVVIIDTALGVSAVYTVESLSKEYNPNGTFKETLDLTKNGN